MKKLRLPERAGVFFRDTVWSVAGLVLMNAAAQLLVYPFWERSFGTEKYGGIIYLLALMNIFAVTFGSALSYTRIMASAKGETRNTPYLRMLLLLGLVSAGLGLLIWALERNSLSTGEGAGYLALCVLTAWRYYGDVEYRLHLNYRGYFLYYLLIGLGYLAGVPLMRATGLWPLALLPGELLGLLYILVRGHIFRPDGAAPGALRELGGMFLVLCGSNLLNALVFNADRVLLQYSLGSAAVSVYYIASLLGKTLSLFTTPLNGVISGYIARYRGGLGRREKRLLVCGALLLALGAAGLCTLGAYILLPLLYPETFPLARDSVFVCSLAQTLFFSGNILSVVMLRFAEKKHQLLSNAVYAAAFTLLCVPLTLCLGLPGFRLGLVLTSGSRLCYNTIILARLREKEKDQQWG